MSNHLYDGCNHSPPKWAQQVLAWSLPASLQEPVLGDLEEEFFEKRQHSGETLARFWYLRQAILTSVTFLKQTQRGMLMFVLSLLVLVVIVGIAFLMSGDLGMFINIPSLIIVLPIALTFSIAATSKQALLNGFKVLLDDQHTLDKRQLMASKRAFVTLGNTAMLCGYLGVVIGLIAMASNIEPEVFKKVFGPAAAVCLLTMLYALLIKLPCYLSEQKIQHKLEDLEN